MDIKWLLGECDVTHKSSEKIYSKLNTTSELRVNFVSVSDVISSYMCERFQVFLLHCRKEVTCVAERDGTNGDRKELFVEIVIGKEDTGFVGKGTHDYFC